MKLPVLGESAGPGEVAVRGVITAMYGMGIFTYYVAAMGGFATSPLYEWAVVDGELVHRQRPDAFPPAVMGV